ncbi:MAG: acyltransferase family protein [Solirubrobacteraceae bacterium]
MPEPLRRSQRYMPGLDGVRAIAVIAVILYHLGFSWTPGGLLGVGVFFTLSGYLITDLLLAQLDRGSGTRAMLGEFWLRRARRLLPALFVMLAVVAAWVALVGPAQPPQFGRAVAAAALYVANWQLIVQHVSYFARFATPSSLEHLWSLGVEEQFYILWPPLLLLGLRFVRERSRLKPRLAGLTLLLAGGSALEMALLYHPSFDPSRVYYGTDTRAFELLIGAALAMVWPSAQLRGSVARGAVAALDVVGAVCLLGILAMIWRVGEFSPFLYEGGFVLLSFATALLVATLAHPASRLAGAVGCKPLRWIGERSYGIYLWHYPIIVLTTPAGAHGVDPLRALAQVAATVLLAALSWRYVEQPIRHGALGRLWRRARRRGLRTAAIPRTGWAALAGSVALVALAGVGVAGVSLAGPARAPHGDLSASVGSSFVAPGDPSAARKRAGGSGGGAPRTSCRAVIHIGDSTSEGLISTSYLPDPVHRIEHQYARVGVRVQHYEIAGARSIVERYEAEPNAYEVAKEWKRRGYHGCWVLALGTNDAADIAVGSKVGMRGRIGEMMSVIGREPVMWVNVKTLLSSGAYSERYMREWDETLAGACSAYPTMRVFDWAQLAQPQWFIEDGIHYTTPGYRARARLIAQALAAAFPEHGKSEGCVVR